MSTIDLKDRFCLMEMNVLKARQGASYNDSINKKKRNQHYKL